MEYFIANLITRLINITPYLFLSNSIFFDFEAFLLSRRVKKKKIVTERTELILVQLEQLKQLTKRKKK